MILTGQVRLNLKCRNLNEDRLFAIVDNGNIGVKPCVILGLPWLSTHNPIIDFRNSSFSLSRTADLKDRNLSCKQREATKPKMSEEEYENYIKENIQW